MLKANKWPWALLWNFDPIDFDLKVAGIVSLTFLTSDIYEIGLFCKHECLVKFPGLAFYSKLSSKLLIRLKASHMMNKSKENN